MNNSERARLYRLSDAYALDDVYTRYSRAKEQAYNAILDEMYQRDGYDLRITSHNSQFFSCAYRWVHPVSGREMLTYHTAFRTYEQPMLYS